MVCALTAGAARAGELGLAGGRNVVWVFQSRIDPPEPTRRLYFGFMNLDESAARFRPLNQPEIGGEVIRAAVRGRRLHVFFRDGSHVRYEPEVRRIAEPEANYWELKLPDSFVPFAVAGDAAQDVLYALVLGRIAEAVHSAEAVRDAEDVGTAGAPAAQDAAPVGRLGTDDVTVDAARAGTGGWSMRTAPDSTGGADKRVTTRPVASKFCLVRYEQGRWRLDRELPEFFDDQNASLLACDGGVCDLYFARAGEDPRVWFSRGEHASWSPPEPVHDAPWSELLCVTLAGDRAQAVTSGGSSLRILVRESTRWSQSLELPLTGLVTPEGGRPLVAALATERLAAAWKDAEGSIRSALWDSFGKPLGAAKPIDALAAPPRAEGLRTVRAIAPFIVLGICLVYVFARRRESVAFAAPIKPDQQLAGFGRRVAAFALDIVVAAPVAVPILYGWTRHVNAESDVFVGVQVAMAEHFVELFWRWLIALGVFVVYCAAFEAARGATPGKLLVGCRVVTERGERCGVRAILMRNVARILELFPGFDFAPLLLLVFLTRNRQRLGDLVARTVVVEIRPEGSNNSPDDNGLDEPGDAAG